MSDDFKIKAAWTTPADRFSVSILTLDFSGRITRELDKSDFNSSRDATSAMTTMIVEVARTVHNATAFQAISVMRNGLPVIIGEGSHIPPTPTFLLEERNARLRAENEELTAKLSDAIAQRDELRRIFAPAPGSIPTDFRAGYWPGIPGIGERFSVTWQDGETQRFTCTGHHAPPAT